MVNKPPLNHPVKEGSNPNSEVVSDENWRWVGEKLLGKAIEIGKSGNGTVVYEGSYDGSTVAVKRLLLSHLKGNYDEIELLRKSRHHQNIVRYYGDERDRDFVYLAMERCACNLDDLIRMSSADFSSQYELLPEKHDDDRSTGPMSQEDGMEKDEYEIVKKDRIVDIMSVVVYQDDRSEKLKSILGDVKLWEESNGRPSPLLLKLMRFRRTSFRPSYDASLFVHVDTSTTLSILVGHDLLFMNKAKDLLKSDDYNFVNSLKPKILCNPNMSKKEEVEDEFEASLRNLPKREKSLVNDVYLYYQGCWIPEICQF